MSDRPGLDVAVVMRRVPTSSPWQPWRWELSEVVPQEESFGTEPRLLYKGEDGERWLHPGFRAELFRDEADRPRNKGRARARHRSDRGGAGDRGLQAAQRVRACPWLWVGPLSSSPVSR